MRIAIDIMGGDYAPVETVAGAIDFKKQYPAVDVVLIGDGDAIAAELGKNNAQAADFTIVATTETIGMHESPTKAFASKPNNTIALGYGMLAKKQIDGFCSAGNTGAMMVGAMFTVKAIPGVSRPCIAAGVPRLTGRNGIILDMGVNADCKPENLRDFALLGSNYARALGLDNPTVGLLNMGEEEGKGNQLAKEAYDLIKNDTRIQFVGNIEGRDILAPKADVIVCDGFTGNIILKFGESFYTLIKKFAGSALGDHAEAFNFENFGGSPILGVNGTAVVGHGISNAKAICSMLKLTMNMVESNMVENIRSSFATVTA